MENKILEFVTEFNAGLEDSNEQNCLIFQDSGFWQSVMLRDIYVWDSENYSEHYFETQALCSLTRQFYEVLKVSNEMLVPKIRGFFNGQKTKIKEKFPEVKFLYARGGTILDYVVTISGKYDEEKMEEFVEILREDFEFEFEGLKAEIKYQ